MVHCFRPTGRMRYGINQKTLAKWKKRTSVAGLLTEPKEPHSTVLSLEEEAIIVALRKRTLLPLDDCLYEPTLPHLTRSFLHRYLQRHDISRLPDVVGDKPAKKKFKSYTTARVSSRRPPPFVPLPQTFLCPKSIDICDQFY